tara:strand:- start:9023 stop:9202 length:180 start_codon:yes stop_codon:yes gene_type:complete
MGNLANIGDFISFTLDPPVAWIDNKNVARFIRRDGEGDPLYCHGPIKIIVWAQSNKTIL